MNTQAEATPRSNLSPNGWLYFKVLNSGFKHELAIIAFSCLENRCHCWQTQTPSGPSERNKNRQGKVSKSSCPTVSQLSSIRLNTTAISVGPAHFKRCSLSVFFSLLLNDISAHMHWHILCLTRLWFIFSSSHAHKWCSALAVPSGSA